MDARNQRDQQLRRWDGGLLRTATIPSARLQAIAVTKTDLSDVYRSYPHVLLRCFLNYLVTAVRMIFVLYAFERRLHDRSLDS